MKTTILFLLIGLVMFGQKTFNNERKVIYDGKNKTIYCTDKHDNCLTFINCDTVIIYDSFFISLNDSNINDRAIKIIKCKYLRISNVNITNFGYGGIEIMHNDSGMNAIIERSYFQNNYKRRSGNGEGYGISIYGECNNWINNIDSINPVIIKDCFFTGHRHAIAGGGNGVYNVYNCIFLDNLWSSHVIDGHDVSNSGKYNIYPTRLMIVTNNTIINNYYKYYKKGIDNSLQGIYLVNVGILCKGGTLIAKNNNIKGCRFGVGLMSSSNIHPPNDAIIEGTIFEPYKSLNSSSAFYNFSPNFINK